MTCQLQFHSLFHPDCLLQLLHEETHSFDDFVIEVVELTIFGLAQALSSTTNRVFTKLWHVGRWKQSQWGGEDIPCTPWRIQYGLPCHANSVLLDQRTRGLQTMAHKAFSSGTWRYFCVWKRLIFARHYFSLSMLLAPTAV